MKTTKGDDEADRIWSEIARDSRSTVIRSFLKVGRDSDCIGEEGEIGALSSRLRISSDKDRSHHYDFIAGLRMKT